MLQLLLKLAPIPLDVDGLERNLCIKEEPEVVRTKGVARHAVP